MHLSVSGEDVFNPRSDFKYERSGFGILRGHELFRGKGGVNQLMCQRKVGVELASNTGGEKLCQDLTDSHHSCCLCMSLVFISFSTWQGPCP